MKKAKTALSPENSKFTSVVYMAIELSKKTWKLAFSNGLKDRFVSVDGGDLIGLTEAINKSKKRLDLSASGPVKSCFEAGRDGVWLHRFLASIGVENLVVDSSSIEVNRRKKHRKTDRLDARSLMRLLIRHHRPSHPEDRRCFSAVRIPSPEVEDERRVNREIERLKKEESGHRSRIKSILITLGLRLKSLVGLEAYLTQARLWDGTEIRTHTLAELRREYARYELLHKQILELEKDQKAWLEEASSPCFRKAKALTGFRGVGARGSVVVSQEYLGWRQFPNRRQVGSGIGLTPTPSISGEGERELGINKAGNRRARAVMIQLAWCWLRFQPESDLSKWFNERFGQGKRIRRIGIVALARKLVIAFWRYLEFGVIPEGAVLQE
jgi:transposase